MEWSRLLCPLRQRMTASAPNAADLRSEFQKDYHRIIGSAAFRRLQDKAQVFPLMRGDFVRTRLTHSLEVSSLAASLGQNVGAELFRRGEISDAERAAIADILRAAGLVHDIGNPPFGHFGETAIRSWFERNLPRLTLGDERVEHLLTPRQTFDFLRFEGNAQALRLLTKLNYLVDENGMNLTYGLLNTIVKYPIPSDRVDRTSGMAQTKKAGYFYAEDALYAEISSATGAKHCRHPLTYLLEAADDTAYLTADIEDAVKKEKIDCMTLAEELSAFPAEARDKECLQREADALRSRSAQAKRLSLPDPAMNAVQLRMVRIQGMFLQAAVRAFFAYYDEILAGEYGGELLADSDAASLARALGAISYRYSFRSKEILKLEIGAGTALDFLLDKFVPAALHYDSAVRMTPLEDKLVALISENYKKAYADAAAGKSPTERVYDRLLLVTDYLCGMTDSYALTLFHELSGIK